MQKKFKIIIYILLFVFILFGISNKSMAYDIVNGIEEGVGTTRLKLGMLALVQLEQYYWGVNFWGVYFGNNTDDNTLGEIGTIGEVNSILRERRI